MSGDNPDHASSLSIPQTIDTTLMDMGVQDRLVRQELEETVRLKSEKLLQKFWEYEKRTKREVQTDLIGIE